MQCSLKIQGQREIVRRLSLVEDRVAKKALKKAALAGAQIVVDAAKARAPVRTGNLRDHIVAEAVKVERDHVEVNVGPDKEAFYGMFIELGTSKMPARPFLRPALDENKERATQAVWVELDHAIREVVPK